MTITRLGADASTRFDCLDLAWRAPLTVPARPTTWGRIKALYVASVERE